VRPLAFCIPGDLDLPTGGYRYDREVLKRLPGLGLHAVHAPLGEGFPHPDQGQIVQALESMAVIDRRTTLLIDGLALGALPPKRIAALPHRKIALVHHPLGLEAGTPPDRAAFLMRNEAAVLAHVAHVVVTSGTTRRILVDAFNLEANRITVVEPGTGIRPRAAGSGSPLHILAVGAVSARKDYPRLVKALAEVSEFDWRLTIAGSLDLAPAAVIELRQAIARHGLSDRVALAGAVGDEPLAALYDRADIFAASSLFEGYGMALTEALAHGLPIVTSSGGAASDTVPDSAALKVPPGNAAALTAALRRMMSEPALRRRMGDASFAAAALLPGWDDTAQGIAEVVKNQ
jgi:glycosyltransferase involved in cell wall biosynthesis